MDGASFVVQSLIDPTWFPQPTPRRFFAVLWTSGAVRLLGLVAPDAIVLGSFLFGLAAFTQTLIPVIVILRADLDEKIRHLLLVLFLSATVFISNFVVTELLFLLALSTIFTVFTLSPTADPSGRLRMLVAVLLIASYEVVVLTNTLLAIGSYLHGTQERRSRSSKIVLILLLLAAIPFQIGFYLINSFPHTGNELNPFVFALICVLGLAMVVASLGIRFLDRLHVPAFLIALIGFGIPVSLAFLDPAIAIRTRLYQWAYASRFYTVCVTITIAALPLVTHTLLRPILMSVLDWFGEKTLRGTSMAMVGFFLGFSLLASADAYRYRMALENAFTRHAGVISVNDCDFCEHPARYGVPDLGYPWLWPLYSIAYSMKRQDQPALLVFHPAGDAREVDKKQMHGVFQKQIALRAVRHSVVGDKK